MFGLGGNLNRFEFPPNPSYNHELCGQQKIETTCIVMYMKISIVTWEPIFQRMMFSTLRLTSTRTRKVTKSFEISLSGSSVIMTMSYHILILDMLV